MQTNEQLVLDMEEQLIEHDLTADELANFIKLTPKGKSAWRWITINGQRHELKNPLVEHDGHAIVLAVGTLSFQEQGSTNWLRAAAAPGLVVRGVYNAVMALRAQRVEAAKKAAVTRQSRRHRLLLQARQAYLDHKLKPRKNCLCCERGLKDDKSIQRGIGPECWQDVIRVAHVAEYVKQAKADSAQAGLGAAV